MDNRSCHSSMQTRSNNWKMNWNRTKKVGKPVWTQLTTAPMQSAIWTKRTDVWKRRIMSCRRNSRVRKRKRERERTRRRLSFFEELSAKTVESISTASSSNESFQKDDVDVECDGSEPGLVHDVPTKSNHEDTKSFDSKSFVTSERSTRMALAIRIAQSIRLETEQEEKRLLQEQIHQLEQSSNEAKTKLSKQIDNVSRRFNDREKKNNSICF